MTSPARAAPARLGLREWWALALGILAAIAIRAILLPRPGLAGDPDDFLAWARYIGTNGLGHAYDQPISFPPVLPWIWWLVGGMAPALLNPAPGDPAAIALLKLPATLADFGLAALVGWSLRARPAVAAAAGIAVLIAPAVWYVSAWWGQFESLYALPLVGAWALLRAGRPGLAAVAIAVGIMTKPQALPLIVPFAAYYLGRFGWRPTVRAGLIGTATTALLWAPFLAADGPAHYLRHLADYTAQFAVLSLRAWNPWWVLQTVAAGDQLIADDVPMAGPITLRWVGLALTLALEGLVFLWIRRRPTPSRLAWGLAAAALVAFSALTTMHERYAWPALVFLLLAWPSRLAIGTWVVLAAAVSLNVVAAVPPEGGPGALIPVGGWLGILGSGAMLAALLATLYGLRRAAADTPAGDGKGEMALLSGGAPGG